jgi:hypothetical protein
MIVVLVGAEIVRPCSWNAWWPLKKGATSDAQCRPCMQL